jgi:hypothetical protein
MHQFDAAALDLNTPRLSDEVSTCELSALLPGLRTEMFHGNRVDCALHRQPEQRGAVLCTVFNRRAHISYCDQH